MSHIVKSPLVIAKAEDGSDVYLYRGAPVPSHIDSKEIARLVEGGFIEEVTAEKAEPEFPEGPPSESWKGEQLKAYAKANEIDLGGATNKADMVAAIAASKA